MVISLETFTRRKPLDPNSIKSSKLKRCLTTLDLTALGIGSTLGLGVYVLAGQVASIKAGPAVTISFFIAAVASVFAGLCYAEFGARVPRAGSAYVYSYITVGEFMAFIIGWNLILEYVIGTASVARGYSGYLDSLIDDTIKRHLLQWMPLNISWISQYPDFFALGITLLLTVMLVVGVKESTTFNTLFTVVNLLVVLYSIIVGAFKANLANWELSYNDVPHGDGKTTPNGGNGGFFPFGITSIKGMMAGAATCFYGFVGFDAIATTGEEVLNPQKSIPISIVLSLLFISLAYSGVSAIQTLIWPYWDQNQDAPLPYVFERVGYPVAKWVISVGALAGLSTSLLGAMFPLPRILYAMGSDRLIFRFLADIHPKYKTPVLATILSGIFAGIMAAMFDVSQLADMMSIGTLLAYSLVAVSVLILRYDEDDQYLSRASGNDGESGNEFGDESETNDSYNQQMISVNSSLWRQLFNSNSNIYPNSMSSKISIKLIIAICLLLVTLNILLVIFDDEIYSLSVPPLVITGIVVLVVAIIIALIALGRQPTSQRRISFKVPFVPVIPVLSVFANTNLMLQLSTMTWYRFAIWMVIGFLIYFLYGIRNSVGYLSDADRRLLSSSMSSIASSTSSSSSTSLVTDNTERDVFLAKNPESNEINS